MPCFDLSSTNSVLWIFGFVIFHSITASAFTQCYFPDGSIPTDYLWEPCTGAQYSSCCVPSEGDICQENGLCFFPDLGQLYRGTCTDRTWNDPSCNADICVTGYETTWDWVIGCESSGVSSWACGNVTDNTHQTATCTGSAQTQTIAIQSTTTTSSAGRYTSPPPIDTSLYSVFTNTYTITLSAAAQSTTLTSTFESTLTSTLSGRSTGKSTAASSGTPAALSTTAPAGGTKRVVLSMGVLVTIFVGPALAIGAGLGIFFFMRRRSRKAVRLNSPSPPPPNGPVGAAQVNPYEMDAYESTGIQRKKYEYSSPRVDSHEAGGDQNGFRTEKTYAQPGAMEIDGDELGSPRSPAPQYQYSEAAVLVELDDTSASRVQNRH